MERTPRKAPPGKFRVIGVDTFDGTDWLEGDFDSLQLAKDHVDKGTKGNDMLKMHMYDENAVHQYEGGSV